MAEQGGPQPIPVILPTDPDDPDETYHLRARDREPKVRAVRFGFLGHHAPRERPVDRYTHGGGRRGGD